MAFLQNGTINRLNIVLGCIRALDAIMITFGPLFLYGLGLSVSHVLIIFGLISFTHLIARFLSLPFITKYGLRISMLIGTTGYGISALILSQAQALDIWFICFVVLFSIMGALHWLCYHTLYMMQGDEEHRGKQYSVGIICSIIASAILPIIGGYLIQHYDYPTYALCAVPITIIALLSMAFHKTHIQTNTKISAFIDEKKRFNISFYLAIANGFFITYFRCAWIFIVFFTVGDFVTFGWLIAFGVIVQALIQLAIGYTNDKGAATHINNIGLFFIIFSIAIASTVPLNIPIILVIEFILAIGLLHTDTALSVIIYNDGEKSKNPLWYFFISEAGWDIGNGLGFIAPAVLLLLGVPLTHSLPISLIGSVICWILIQRYHRDSAVQKTLIDA